MNRGVLQSSRPGAVQQMMMMGGIPSSSWWSNINSLSTHHQQEASPFLPPPQTPAFFPQFTPTSSSSLPLIIPSTNWHDNHNQELPAGSWSQLLL